MKTMVLAMGEFGRTPKVNPAGSAIITQVVSEHHHGRRPAQGRPGGGADLDEPGYAPKALDQSRQVEVSGDDLQAASASIRTKNCPVRKGGRFRSGRFQFEVDRRASSDAESWR